MIIRYFGHEGLAARIREHCRLAKLFASWVNEADEWELLAPVPLGLICFRACPSINGDQAVRNKRLDVLNEAILHSVNSSGKALLSHTRLHDKVTLRLSIGNIRTTEKHVRQVWELLNEALGKLRSRFQPRLSRNAKAPRRQETVPNNVGQTRLANN